MHRERTCRNITLETKVTRGKAAAESSSAQQPAPTVDGRGGELASDEEKPAQRLKWIGPVEFWNLLISRWNVDQEPLWIIHKGVKVDTPSSASPPSHCDDEKREVETTCENHEDDGFRVKPHCRDYLGISITMHHCDRVSRWYWSSKKGGILQAAGTLDFILMCKWASGPVTLAQDIIYSNCGDWNRGAEPGARIAVQMGWDGVLWGKEWTQKMVCSLQS